MQGTMLFMLFAVFLAGAVGGVVNALMTDNGFLLPKREMVDETTSLLRPGYFGNVIIGAVAAVVSWGLYGPLSAFPIVGTQEALAAGGSADRMGLSLASMVGALMVGMGGARWLSSEVDKNMLRAAAAQAAGSEASLGASQRIALARPAQALGVAREMKE